MNIYLHLKPLFHSLAVCSLSLLCFGLVFAQPTPDDFTTITLDNANQLELGYVLPGFCGADEPNNNLTALWQVGVYDLFTGQQRFEIADESGVFSPSGNYFVSSSEGVVHTSTGEEVFPKGDFLSPDEKYLALRRSGIYELATGKKLFPIINLGWFSPDSQLIAVWRDAMYDIETGRSLYDLPDGLVEFSPNGEYFAVWQSGIYETKTGEQTIPSSGTIPEFSSDSNYVSMSGDGVYELKSGQKLLSLKSDPKTTFSPDSQYIALTADGVYDLATQKRLFSIGGTEYSNPYFIENTPWLVLDDVGVYDLNNGQKLYSFDGLFRSVTADKNLITLSNSGLVEVSTGALKYQVQNARFAAKDKLVLSITGSLDGYACAVYGITGNKWPYRSGLINMARITIYTLPDGQPRADMPQRNLSLINQMIVFAQTADGQWLRIGKDAWVKAADVRAVSLPEGIPIE